MASLFRIGQVLKGRLGIYTITKEIQCTTAWFAKNQLQENVVIKSVQGHHRVENERDVLKHSQHRTPHLRPLIDEIEELSQPTTIVLKYLDSTLSEQTHNSKPPLNRKEIKYVSRSILRALSVLHEDGLVHGDVKPGNVLVNLREGGIRFSDVQLGDLGSCYHKDSKWATTGAFCGTPVYASPEQIMEMPWNTASDVWSFGAVLISLIYGRNLTIFDPGDTAPELDEKGYRLEVLKEQLRYFSYFGKFGEIASPDQLEGLVLLQKELDTFILFHRVTNKQFTQMDKDFICKMMNFDWRIRPTVKELLKDDWWDVEEEQEPSDALSLFTDQSQNQDVQQAIC